MVQVSEQKNLLEERIFFCKIVDFLIDTFTTDLNQADAKHAFDHFKQASKEAVADYMERAVVLGGHSG